MFFIKLYELKQYDCPELEICFKPVSDESVKWGDFLTSKNELFRIDWRTNTLINNQIIVPIFIVEEMLPFDYVHQTKFSTETHPSYCHFSTIRINYKRAHLMKITQQFGVKVLKLSEEKYLNPLIKEEVEHHFKYDFEEERWKYIESGSVEKHWITEKEKLDEAKNDEEVRAAAKVYFTSRSQVLPLQSDRYDTYSEELDAYESLVKTASSFFEYKRLLGEISKLHNELIDEHLNILSNSILKAQQYVENEELSFKMDTRLITSIHGIEHKHIINRLADIKTNIKKIFFTPAYWVIDDDVYPNISEQFDLLQKSETNRNVQTKYDLKQKILDKHKTEKHSYITVESAKN